MENIIESTVNAEPVVNVEPQVNEQVDTTIESGEKVEVAEQPKVEEKPAQSAEENAKYAAIRREAEQKATTKARDEMIAEMYGQSHGIYTYADYQKAVEKQKEQDRLREMINEKGLPEDVAKELLESKKFREQIENERKVFAEKEAREKDFKSFIETYPSVKPEEIPAEVWEENNNGKSLVDAYAKYENKVLKQKLAEYEKGSIAKEINNKNAATSTGSVTGNGQIAGDYFTQEQVKSMSEKEVVSNYDKIMESMKQWNK